MFDSVVEGEMFSLVIVETFKLLEIGDIYNRETK